MPPLKPNGTTTRKD
jgi:hypothetical protein